MKIDDKSLFLYLVTDRRWIDESSLEVQVEESLKNGVTFLQLREKNLEYDEFLKLALRIKQISKKYKVPFVINDDIKVAVDSDADGLHIGQGDMDVYNARKLLGDNKILGVSALTVKQAIKAEQDGADYIGVGSMFITDTKNDADYVSFDELKQICNIVSIPVVAIGGINENNILELKGSGIDGVAVVSAILSKKDISSATRILNNLCKEVVGDSVFD
ncbi:MAG: thiamine phosphate synthase [Eubacteriaceae bacterium]